MENNKVLVRIGGNEVELELNRKGKVSASSKQKAFVGRALVAAGLEDTKEEVYVRNNYTDYLVGASMAGEVVERTHVVADSTTTEQATNQNEKVEETMTITTNNTAVVAEEAVEVKETTLRDKAIKLVEMMKNGEKDAPKKEEIKVKIISFVNNIKEQITKVWDTVKNYDYKAATQSVWASVNKVYDTVDNWLFNSKTGRATAYTTVATGTMTFVGIFFAPIATVLVGSAVYTGVKEFMADREKFTVKEIAKAFAINTALFATITTVAFFTVPFVYTTMASVCHTAVLLTMVLPASMILF